MKKFQLSPEAASDIREIWSYVAADSVPAARKVRLALLDACQLLAENPKIGHTREDLTDQGVLFWPWVPT
jgi:toxin ParE1/3/4